MATNATNDRTSLMNKDNGIENEYVEGDIERQNWSGRVSFWLAAVGSAVGLGNLWRFPWQCARFGGGAFIFAYFVCLFTLGMPLLTQELALGQKHRSGDIEAFGRMNWRLRGIGLASVIGGFGIVTYYMMIIGISMVFFFESFISPLPYGGNISEGSNYYATHVLMVADSIDDSNFTMSGKLYLATCFCWIITFLCIMKGVDSASWAVKITMPLPLLLLFIMLIKGLTLDGAWKGIKAYWDFSNWDYLSDSGIWNAAIGQCFFSLSVCMGVMTAYGSYNPKRQDIATDEKVIAFLDVGTSLLSGFVVYSVLGYVAFRTGDDDIFTQASLGLVFSVFPVAIQEFAGSNFFGIIFYLTLVLLGIDSAFSIVEAISTVIADSDLNLYRLKWSRTKISAILCVIGALCSSLYCFDTGLYWFDIVDRYINNYGMIFLGIMEAGACGWYYKYKIIESKIGNISASIYRLGFWFALLLACFLGFSLATPVQNEPNGKFVFIGTLGYDSWIVGFIVGIIIWIITIIISYIKRSDYAKKNLSFLKTIWYIMGWENVEMLRDFINQNGLGDEAWKNSKHTLKGEIYAALHHSSIGIWWGFLIKYWLPCVLMVNLIGVMREERWNPYGGYPKKNLILGIIIFSSMVIIVFIVALYPQWMTQKIDQTGKYNNLDDDDENNNNQNNKQQIIQQIYDSYDDEKDNEKDDEKEEKQQQKIQIQLVEEKKPKENQTQTYTQKIDDQEKDKNKHATKEKTDDTTKDDYAD